MHLERRDAPVRGLCRVFTEFTWDCLYSRVFEKRDVARDGVLSVAWINNIVVRHAKQHAK